MNKLKTIFRSLHWKNILGLTIAGLINAFGITIFLSPVNLYDSGISGTSMLLSQITPEHLSLSVFLYKTCLCDRPRHAWMGTL